MKKATLSTKHRLISIVIFLVMIFLSNQKCHAQDSSFNSYLLRAVDSIQQHWRLQGYNLHCALTHDLQLGRVKLKATRPSLTMCVAAQLELIITALNIYTEESKDTAYYSFLKPEQWMYSRGGSIRDMIWVNSGSNGTADAVRKFGMGDTVIFEDLRPGCFVNLNREKSGHAVLFLAFLDSTGKEMNWYSPEVKGFKYYSSQGSEIVGKGGYGYRYAFFGKTCPVLEPGKKRDCGVIFSRKQKLLNCGYMYAPKFWVVTRRDKTISQYPAGNRPLFKKVNGVVQQDGVLNGVNPRYWVQNTTDN
jgi:hypothetical protein